MSIALALLAAVALQTGAVRIADHEMAVQFDPATHMLKVTDTITISGEGPVLFGILNENFSVDSIRAGEASLTFHWTEEKEAAETLKNLGWPVDTLEGNAGLLIIDLPATRPIETKLMLSYGGVVYDKREESSFGHESISEQTTGIIGEEGVYVAPSTNWYLSQPDQLVVYRMEVTGPAGWEVMSEGDILGREEKDGKLITRFGFDHPFDGIHLIAGRFVIGREKQGNVDILTYFFPGSEELSPRYLSACKRYLEMYDEMLGPYPFGKFAVVENFFASGYGMPSFTLLGSQVIRLPFIVDISLGHEIAHNWWGNSVYVDSRRGNWCEGLTVYVADYHYLELENQADADEYRRNTLRDYTNYVGKGNDFSLRDFHERHSAATRAVGYGKSMMVFHTIRRTIGDEAFYGAIKEIVRRYQWKSASWEDLIGVFSETSGKNLDWVLSEYIDRVGAPFIELVSAESATADPGGSVIRGWKIDFELKQTEPLYGLDVPVQIDLGGGEKEVQTVRLEAESGKFELTSASHPYGISIDPDCQLFRRLHREEIPPVLSQVFGGHDKLIILPDSADEAKLEAYKQAAAELGQGNNTTIKTACEATEEELARSTLIILGGPSENSLAERWKEEMPNGSIVDSGGFILEGEEHAAGSLAAVACLRHPLNPELGAVVMAANEAEAVKSLGNRLLHYGKYSYLGFKDGKNIVKGIWEIESSPLIHKFEE
jgi:aminopeptidase N